ncbi:hypothetical protein FBU30_009443 [Linnemannia zychae]|nr:hypothetical protein FBU30_009443 [Linnemannia zychae]
MLINSAFQNTPLKDSLESTSNYDSNGYVYPSPSLSPIALFHATIDSVSTQNQSRSSVKYLMNQANPPATSLDALVLALEATAEELENDQGYAPLRQATSADTDDLAEDPNATVPSSPTFFVKKSDAPSLHQLPTLHLPESIVSSQTLPLPLSSSEASFPPSPLSPILPLSTFSSQSNVLPKIHQRKSSVCSQSSISSSESLGERTKAFACTIGNCHKKFYQVAHLRIHERSTYRMQMRIRQLFSRATNTFALQDLLHGYMFDAWSGRKCSDQFLELNVKWPLTTDAYLELITDFDLFDLFLATLFTVSSQECARLLDLILCSSRLAAEQLSHLFIWTMDQIHIFYNNKQDPSSSLQDTNNSHNPGDLIRIWVNRIKESEKTRGLFCVSLRKILRQVILRQSRLHNRMVGSWRLNEKDLDGLNQSQVADEIIQGVLVEIITILTNHSSLEENSSIQEMYDDLAKWDKWMVGSGPKLSELVPLAERSSKRRRHEESETRESKDRLQKVLKNDAQYAAKIHKSHPIPQETPPTRPSFMDHQEAFITICNNLRLHQDIPTRPSMPMARLLTHNVQTLHQERSDILKDHIEWIESTIQRRSYGWLSYAKLKLQFFALFNDSYINEEFADIISEENLHWDMCETLLRYLRRHRADPIRMPTETFQLGCELLLSVFTKRADLRLALRDRLFCQSG